MAVLLFDEPIPKAFNNRLTNYLEHKFNNNCDYKSYGLFFGIHSKREDYRRIEGISFEGIEDPVDDFFIDRPTECMLTLDSNRDRGKEIDFGLLTNLGYDDVLEVELAYGEPYFNINHIFYLDYRDQIYGNKKYKKYFKELKMTVDQLLVFTSLDNEDFIRSILLNFDNDNPLGSLKYCFEMLEYAKERESKLRRLEEEKRLKEFYYHRFDEVI